MHRFIVSWQILTMVFGTEGLLIDQEFSREIDEKDLLASIKRRINTNIAKNIILFIGDGMGPNTVTAGRIYRAGETSYLAWEKFPHFAAIKTYSADKQVPDSASTATAMFTGVKNNFEMLGLDANVQIMDCERSLNEIYHLTTLAKLAQDAGKATGIVTTTRITDATPAAMYSRSAHRNWECDSALPVNAMRCTDIARQLVENFPGKSFNVIMGGGTQVLRANATSTNNDPIDKTCCERSDGRDLIAEWAQEKSRMKLKFALANDTKSLLGVDTNNVDYLLGIFSNSHMSYDYQRDKTEHGQPSLEQMTTTSIKLLSRSSNGFFLMVEGGMIDKGHHLGKARVALHDVLSFNDAVNATMNLLDSLEIRDDTLVIVTSDHSHTLTMSGYPTLGNNIFGIADKSLVDGVPYTTLSYANSVKENFHFTVKEGQVVREDPSTVDTTSFDYHVTAPVITDMNTHGGSDVHVYASGPYAHLFQNVHENTYIATVIKYAAHLKKYDEANSSHRLESRNGLYLLICIASLFSIVHFVYK